MRQDGDHSDWPGAPEHRPTSSRSSQIVKSKHDADCLRRREVHRYVCTCGMTDEDVARVTLGDG